LNGKWFTNVRIPLCGKKSPSNPTGSLSLEKIERIVDPAIRLAVLNKLQELDGSLATCESSGNWPSLCSSEGKIIPIKKVRIRQARNPQDSDMPDKNRFVDSAGIHHVELFVTRDAKRRECWDSEVVQVTEIYRRFPRRDRRRGRPQKEVENHADIRRLKSDPEAQFLFSLMKDDTVLIENEGRDNIYRVKKFEATGKITFVPVNNAMPDKLQYSTKAAWSKMPTTLRALKPRKVVVDLLGRIHPAND
jgi:hypothetical protein